MIMAAAVPFTSTSTEAYRNDPTTPTAFAFLYSTPFNDAFKLSAEKAVSEFGITAEEATKQIRRYVVIEATTSVRFATRFSPTQLSDPPLCFFRAFP